METNEMLYFVDDDCDFKFAANADAGAPPGDGVEEETEFLELDDEGPLEASFEIKAEQEPTFASEKTPPKFHLTAYTGAKMVPSNWGAPVVIDLKGIKLLGKTTPIRMNHDGNKGVGHATRVYVKNGALQADGFFSRDTEWSRDIIGSARNGFPWQVSVGGRPVKSTFVDEGASPVVNGKRRRGPFTFISEFELCEISFCDLGADSKTSAVVATRNQEGELVMNDSDDKLLKEPVAETPTEEIADPTPTVEASDSKPPFDKERDEEEEDDEEEKEEEEEEAETKAKAKKAPPKARAAVAASAEAARRNADRIAAINSLEASGFEELKAQAIEEGWSAVKFAQALRAARSDANILDFVPKGAAAMKDLNEQSLEASIVMEILGEAEAEKNYDSNALNRAYDRRRKVSCFRDVFAEALGTHVYKSDLNDGEFIKAAFTTSNLDRIFRNVMNKSMKAGYNLASDSWRKICSVSQSSDFKTLYTYQVGGDFRYKEIAENSSDIEHATFNETEYTNAVRQYARMFTLTYKQMMNDDLNALQVMPKRLGQGAAETLNSEVFTLLLSNKERFETKTGASQKFYCDTHKNYVKGTSAISADLSFDALATATTLIETQETDDGQVIANQGKYLVVPPALKTKALMLMHSTMLNQTSENPVGTFNPYAGQFEVVTVPYLSSSKIPNSSARNWYLFGDPNYVSCIDVVFFHGQETPTIEQQNAAFNTLGIQYRGVFNFGVSLQDYRGSVFMEAETD